MINLLPPQGRQVTRNEYIVRVASIGACALALCFLVGIAFLLPTRILIGSEERVIEERLREATKKDDMYAHAERILREREARQRALTPSDPVVMSSMLLEAARSSASSGIEFSRFHIEIPEGDMPRFTIEGIADTRYALSEMKNILEQNQLFKSASIPLSDLARDRELPFSLEVKVNDKQKK